MNNNALDSHKHWFMVCIILLLPFVFISCAFFKQPIPLSRTEILWTKETPEAVLSRLRQEQNKITDLTAIFSLSLEPPPKGQPSHIHGLLFFSRRPLGLLIRIKGLGPFGRILFDLVHKGDDVQIYIPSRHTLYRGQANQKASSKSIWLDMFSTLMPDVSTAVAAKGSGFSFREAMAIIHLADGEIWIDKKTALILQWHQRGKVVVFDKYEKITADLPPIPTYIRVTTTGGSQNAVCRLSQVSLTSNAAHTFELSGYKPRFIRDLNEINTQSNP